MRSRPDRRLLILLALVALAAHACSRADAKPRPQNGDAFTRAPSAATAAPADAIRVEAAVLEDSDATLQVTLPGEIEGSRDAVLASGQGGPIERILVREGRRVGKGQVLMEVDTALYAIRKRQAETELARARRDHARAQELGSALATAERQGRESDMQVLESHLALAELQLARSQIRAPFAGVVAALHVEVGEVASATAPLVRIVRLNPVHIALSVPDRDIVALRKGDTVAVRVPALAETLSGTISRVSPTGDLDTRSFRAEAEVDNEEMHLLPGMIAQVTLDRPVVSGAMVIPQDFLVTKGDGVGVFLEEGGQARYVQVKAGSVVRDRVVIEEGLSAGARLVVKGHRQLADGDSVVVAREGRCCAQSRAEFE